MGLVTRTNEVVEHFGLMRQLEFKVGSCRDVSQMIVMNTSSTEKSEEEIVKRRDSRYQ